MYEAQTLRTNKEFPFPQLESLQNTLMSSNFCPHLIFKFRDLIEFFVLKD